MIKTPVTGNIAVSNNVKGSLKAKATSNVSKKTGVLYPPQKDANMNVKKNNKVKVHYTGTLADGSVFDKSKPEEPLEFTVGSGQMIPGFDAALEGMVLNEEKEFTINAEDAYGERDDSLTTEIPESSIREGFTAEEGMTIGLQDESGRTIPATVTAVTPAGITVDFNHPMAGKDLTFAIKVVGIE